jgi:hypothetical protein
MPRHPFKVRALRRAAREGFDQIDQGKGIVLKGKRALNRFFREIEHEVRGKTTRNGGR